MRTGLFSPLAGAICLMLFCAGAPAANAYLFTTPGGEKVEGEYVGATPTVANIKFANGQTVAISFSDMTEKDREYVFSCTIKERATRGEALRFRLRENNGSRSSSNGWEQTWQAGYKLTIENLLPVPLEDLRIQYYFCKENDDAYVGRYLNQNYFQEEKIIPAIGSRQSFDFETARLTLKIYKGSSGSRWHTGSLRGLWARFYWKDILVAEYKSSKKMDSERWPDELAAPKKNSPAQ